MEDKLGNVVHNTQNSTCLLETGAISPASRLHKWLYTYVMAFLLCVLEVSCSYADLSLQALDTIIFLVNCRINTAHNKVEWRLLGCYYVWLL
jgi:hypothetical protein